MAAFACPRCKKAFPENASTCPSCGFALWSASASDTARRESQWVEWVIGIAGGCLVVIFVLVMLPRLMAPIFLQRMSVAVTSRLKVDIFSIEQALDEYAINNGTKYPESLEILVTPDANGQTYLKQTTLPLDPWKRPYLYQPPGPSQDRPHVYTLGRDGKPGGAGEDADIDRMSLREER